MLLVDTTSLSVRYASTFLLILLSLTPLTVLANNRLQVVAHQDLPILELGHSSKQKIAEAESHYYRIVLMTDQYLRLVVDQLGIDVAVKLYKPDGNIAAESNRFTGAYGPETISWVAESSGLYKLEVRALQSEHIAQFYEVELLEERFATFQDRSRVALQSVFMQAEALRAQKTPAATDQAIAKYEEALQISRDVSDPAGEAEALNVLGLVYHLLKRDALNARQRYEQALKIRQSLGDRRGEAETLVNIGRLLESQGERQKALDFYELSLQPWQQAGDRYGQAWALNNLGQLYNLLKQAQIGLDYQNRALRIWRDVGDLSREAATLSSIGENYNLLNDYQQALNTYQQARERWQSAGDLNGEVSTLFSISKTYALLQDKQREQEFKTLAEQLRQKIELARAANPENRARLDKVRLAEQAQEEARDLLPQATEASRRKAIAKNEEAVQLFDGIGDYDREVAAIFDVASIYRTLDDKDNERKTLERSLSIGKRVRKTSLQAESLQRLADFHSTFGDQLKAVAFYDHAIELCKSQGNRSAEAYLLASAAKAYKRLGEKEKALAYLQRALKLYQDLGDRFRESYMLNDLAALYDDAEGKQNALGYLKRTRDLRREKGDRAGEAESIKEIIALYLSLGEKREALDYYHQALAMYRETKDGMGAADILRNLMSYWSDQNQPRLAIFYGKQAINTYQEVRRNIQGLEKETQTSFLKSKEDIYRQLADLLISEGRLPEAQQVLDMLKEEEFIKFIRGNVKEVPVGTERAELSPRENKIYEEYRVLTERATAISSEYDKLLSKPGRNEVENRRLNELTAELEIANNNLKVYLDQLSKALLNPDEIKDRLNTMHGYESLRTTLKDLGPGSVALYTLVFKDKYSVILFTPSLRVARQYSIKSADLNRKIMALRVALQNPKSDPLPAAKELYQILVGPVAKDLEGAEAKTLMWSLDGALRYVPIAALHDGEKYMVERYRNEVITLSSLSKLANPASTPWRGLGLGVSNFSEGFDPLPAVVDELNGIFRNEDDPAATGGTLPGKVMLNAQFTKDAMIAALQLQQYKLVHVASHFILQPGDGMSSYLVLGKGEKLTVAQIDAMPTIFTGVDLLTLSACNTAVGASSGTGAEVDGLGEFAQRQGAKAVIASLWSVADASTGLLMQKFYQFRVRDSQPVTSKAAALQEAQLAFLHKRVTSPERDYTHPYFWAPFILIGNWQ
jgi:CHAT domain-containing protein